MPRNNAINNESTTVTAGENKIFTISNTDNTSINSNASLQITTGGAAGGDPFVNFYNGVVNYILGTDNSDSDKFKITTGVTPSSGIDLFTMTSTGVITLANDLDVTEGGTGKGTFTAYSVICAGTTATGDFQNVASVGTAGQVLTSNGAAALPTFQASAGGHGLVYVSNQTASASASIIFNNLTINTKYVLHVYNLTATTDTDSFRMYVSNDNGATWKGAGRYYGGQQRIQYDGTAWANTNSTNFFPLTDATYNLAGAQMEIFFSTVNVGSYLTLGGTAQYNMAGLNNILYGVLEGRSVDTGINAIKIQCSTGTIGNGSFYLYYYA